MKLCNYSAVPNNLCMNDKRDRKRRVCHVQYVYLKCGWRDCLPWGRNGSRCGVRVVWNRRGLKPVGMRVGGGTEGGMEGER